MPADIRGRHSMISGEIRLTAACFRYFKYTEYLDGGKGSIQVVILHGDQYRKGFTKKGLRLPVVAGGMMG